MYLIYSATQGVIEVSADCGQYLAGTKDAIISNASVWIVPGTVEE